MKNTMADLQNYLFETIERVMDESLTDEQLDREIKKADAVQKSAKIAIDNGTLALQVKKHLDEYGQGDSVKLSMFGMPDK